MKNNFNGIVTDFINAYYEENSISAEEMKNIFQMKDATDEELFAEFTEYEIELEKEETEWLHEIISALLYLKSIDDSENYSAHFELLKEYCDSIDDKTLVTSYLKLETDLIKYNLKNQLIEKLC